MLWHSMAAAFISLHATPANADRPSLPLCAETSRDELKAVAELGRWVRSVRVQLSACKDEGALPRLMFVERDRTVLLRLDSTAGSREREVPWLDRAEAPLSRLRARGALARLSVLIDALLADELLARPPPTADLLRAPSPPLSPSRVASRARVATPIAAARPEAPAADTSPASPEPPAASDEPMPPAVPSITAANEDPPVVRAASTPRLPFGLEGFAGWRLRSPGISTFEFGGALRWGVLTLGGSYQPAAEWSLEGRPVELTGVGALLGVRLVLGQTPALRVGLLAGLLAEYLTLRRKDIADARTYGVWDAGVSAGLFASHALGPLRLEVRVEGLALPTGREVVIPDGPQQPLNRFGARATASLSWESSQQ